jgi:hypothetical protein
LSALAPSDPSPETGTPKPKSVQCKKDSGTDFWETLLRLDQVTSYNHFSLLLGDSADPMRMWLGGRNNENQIQGSLSGWIQLRMYNCFYLISCLGFRYIKVGQA